MKGDLHIHSKYSPDSTLEPDKIIKTAKERGLDFIAISDHNRFVEHKGDLLIIRGEEVSSRDGHILALFINGEIPSKLSQEETVDAIHSRNGIAVCAHPYRSVNGIGSKFRDIYDAIETKNARCRRGCNKRSERLAQRLNRPMTAGSDSHHYDEIGRVFIEVDATNEESIRKAIMTGRTKIGGEDLTVLGQIRLYFKLGRDYAFRGFKRI
jgi:predicted metal-dependent phosphoesterase TrpH